MKKIAFLASLLALFSLGALETGTPSIKVLIANNKPGVLLEVRGKYKLYDPHTMEHISTRFVGKRKYLQALSNGIKWGEEFPGTYQLLVQPDDPRTITMVDGVAYQGALYIYDVSGQISIVNEVEIEKYLDSIMASQYRQQAVPEELLGAIAIAQRTQAYYQASHPKSKYWAIEAGKAGYSGTVEHGSNIDRAIQTTKYMVLTQGEQPINVRWEDAQVALGDPNKLASQGENALDILKKAFPGSSLKVLQSN